MDEVKRSSGRDTERSRDRSRHRSRNSRSVSRSRSKRHHHSRRHKHSHSRSPSSERRRRHKRSHSRSGHRRRRTRSRSHSRSRTHNTKKDRRSHSRNRKETAHDNHQPNEAILPENIAPPPPKFEHYAENSTNSQDSVTDSENGNSMYNLEFDGDEPIDKERIHREMEQKLREALAREGKVYPPKKPEASHPVFANDGSFLEIFKKMQQNPESLPTAVANIPSAIAHVVPPQVLSSSPTTAVYVAATAAGRSAPPPPLVGRRRGGKVLKTGLVVKQRVNADDSNADPKDFWSLYLAEVNKYKNTACESETGNRPLVK